jgi:hypothetical protein
VTWSVEPPAAQGTIRLIGRVGFQSAARAGREISEDKRPRTMVESKNVGRRPEYFTYDPFIIRCPNSGLAPLTGCAWIVPNSRRVSLFVKI